MDRNTLIGFALIGLILIIWFQLLSPPKPTPPPKPHDIAIDTTLVSDTLKVAKIDTAQKFGEFSIGARGTEELIVVETDVFTATLSSKGATLKSFIQKKYLDYERKPFDLITAKDGALSLMFETRDAKVSQINTNELYFAPKIQEKKITLTGEQSATIPFELALQGDKKIRIIYTFSGDRYKFNYQTELIGMTDVVRGSDYQVIWNGGLAHSEKDKVDESNRSHAHAYFGGSLEKLDADKTGQEFKLQPSGKTKWVSVRSKYFLAALIGDEQSEGAVLLGKRSSDNPKELFEDYTAALKQKLLLNQSVTRGTFSVYLGPLDYEIVKSVGVDLEKALDFGWEWVTRPFAEYVIIPIFSLLEKFISNYGLIIIIFALFIKLVTYPFTAASTNSMKKMSALQPQIQALQTKYADDPVKLQNELGKVYKEAGVNPLGGCLPVVLQMPLLFSMFYVIGSSIQLRQHGFLWADDLSVVDAVVTLPFAIPLYGAHIAVFPILLAATQVLQMKLTPQTGPAEQQKIFMYVLPAMMLLFFNTMPAGLGLYYLMFNIFSILQQFYINLTTPKTPVKSTVPEPVKSEPKKKKAKAVQ